ncbi:hypothetical protein [Megalodesulfovibrio paquesii]
MSKQNYAVSATVVPVSRVAMGAGAFGAVVGATAGLAEGIAGYRAGTMDKQQAAVHTLKEAGGTGLAAAAGAAVASTVGLGGIVGLVSMIAVGTAVKYVWNNAMSGACKAAVAPAPAEPAIATPEGKGGKVVKQ